MNGLGILAQNPLAIYVWVYIQILSSIQMVYMSILVSGPHGFDYCRFVVFWKSRRVPPLCSSVTNFACLLLFSVLCNSLWILGLAFSLVQKMFIGMTVGVTLNLGILFSSIAILSILSLPIHGHEISVSLFRSSLICLAMFHSFQCIILNLLS